MAGVDSLFGGPGSADTDALFSGVGNGGFPPPVALPFGFGPAASFGAPAEPALPFGGFGAPAESAPPFGVAAGAPPPGVPLPPPAVFPPATAALSFPPAPTMQFAPMQFTPAPFSTDPASAAPSLAPPAVPFPGQAAPAAQPTTPAAFPPAPSPVPAFSPPAFPQPNFSPPTFSQPTFPQPAFSPPPSSAPLPLSTAPQSPFPQAEAAGQQQAPFGNNFVAPQAATIPAALQPDTPFGVMSPSESAPPQVPLPPPPQTNEASPFAGFVPAQMAPFAGSAPAQMAPFPGTAPSPTSGIAPSASPFGVMQTQLPGAAAASPAQTAVPVQTQALFGVQAPALPQSTAPPGVLPPQSAFPQAMAPAWVLPPQSAAPAFPQAAPPPGVLPPQSAAPAFPQAAAPPGVLPPQSSASAFPQATAPPGVLPPQFAAPAFPMPAKSSSASPTASGGRPPCAVMAFGFGGKLLCSGPGGLKEKSVKAILQKSVKGLSDIEDFPGPYGRVDTYVTSIAIEYLEKVSAKLTAEGSQASENMLLRIAAKEPHSAALLCRMLACMLDTGGKVESNEFWGAFLPKLAERGTALCPKVDKLSPLQNFARKLAHGDAAGALAACEDPCLWHHGLIVAPLAAPEAYHKLLSQVTAKLLRPGDASEAAAGGHQLAAAERSDPMVQALLLLYSAVGKQALPDISDAVLESWPSYASVFCGVLRASSDWGLAMSFLEAVGQRLISRGDAFGAHLCYLLTGRTLESIDKPDSLVCLLGIDHREPSNFGSLLDPFATQLSEIYEYALRCGNAEAMCTSLQPFKLVHARVLADLGMEEKAAKYNTLIQAFVKAVPQSRLSEAFRSSMRDFNDQLNPSQVSSDAPRQSIGAAQAVGSMLGLFRGVAEATGFTSRQIAPPALGDDDEDQPTPMQPAMTPATFSAPPAIPPLSRAISTPAAFAPPPVPAQPLGSPMGSAAPAAFAQPPGQSFGYGGGGMPAMQPAASPVMATSGMYPSAMPLLGAAGDAGEGEAPPPPPTPAQNLNAAMDQDPLLSAAKGVFSFGKSMFSKIKGDGERPPDGSTDSQANAFYYDETAKMWRQRGAETLNADDFDPMTGKRKLKPADGPPPMGGPPMGGPPMGGPPMGGPPMGGASMGGGVDALCAPPPSRPRPGMGSGSLYVNPMAGGQMAPPMPGCPMGGAMGGAMGGPMAGGMGNPMGSASAPLSSPFGAPGAVRASPFG